MKIRYFNGKGEEIKTAVCPTYSWRHNTEDNRPQDFVIVKQLEIEKHLTDPYGEPFVMTELSDPVEEDYCRWEWQDGSWYCMISCIIQKQVITLDRRPAGWTLVEDFNKNRPRLR